MSAEKRQELIESGRLRPDGTRIELCPCCSRELPEGQTTSALAAAEHAVGEPGTVVLAGESPAAEGS